MQVFTVRVELTRVDVDVIKRALLMWESGVSEAYDPHNQTAREGGTQVLVSHASDLIHRVAQAEQEAEHEYAGRMAEDKHELPF